ncbi:hypothetical protein RJ639_046982 [Escallonia herrerae]|uniref:Uncharacterized protein n=1 Tax=Escallonia herrerae TaxID=1293975 RepID=A0AA89AWY0_9ASTE|nr:hypothetical protein RJ639_046982 [Escallonia herrerae]
MPVTIRWEDKFWHMAEHGKGFEQCDMGCPHEERALGIWRALAADCGKSERKVDVFAEELDDLIEERVGHFMKGEVQRHKDLKGQVVELQEELATCKKELTRATRHRCIAVQPRQKKMPEPRSYDGTTEARQMDNFFSHLERYFEALDIDEEKVQWTVASQVELIFNRLDDLERKDLKGQVMELQEELVACKKELTRATRHGCIAVQPRQKKMPKPRSYNRTREAWQVDSIDDQHLTTEAEGSICELQRREPHDLASAIAIVERSKSGSPKVTDDERSEDEGHRRHYKREKKHEGSCKQGDSCDYKAHGGPRGGYFYGAGHHYGRYCPHKGVVKNVDLRIGRWTGKKDFNIIDMDELGVVLGMDFMKKLSTALNPYCRVMMMIVGKEGQPDWMIPLVSKDGANARKGITVLQLDEGLTLCYFEWQMGPRTYAIDMLTKMIMTEKAREKSPSLSRPREKSPSLSRKRKKRPSLANMWIFGRKGPSGFSARSTAKEVTQGIDGTGLTAIVTGASSGIGVETTCVLALHGVFVVMAVRNMDAGRKTKEAIVKEIPNAKIDVMELDLSNGIHKEFCIEL